MAMMVMAMADEARMYGQDRAARARRWDEDAFALTFRHAITAVQDGVRIHHVVGGGGTPVVLLHGFPQNWREWRHVMPELAGAGHSVIAPDLRGFGWSDRPLEGFDVGTVSEDIRQLVGKLSQREVTLVGHDLGAVVGYAWAAAHPDEVERLVLIEGLPAGLEPPSAAIPMMRGKPLWHLAFGSTPDVPEALLAGRERIWIEFLLRQGACDPTAFSDEDIDAYAHSFGALGGVRGALAHIRAMPRSAALNRRLAERRLAMPVLAIGAALSYGARMEEGARRFADDVVGMVAEQCGHWIPEERPAWLAQQLIAFLGGEA